MKTTSIKSQNFIVIYLGVDRMHCFLQSKGGIVDFNYPPETVQDLELVNPEEFHLILRTWVDDQGFLPTQLIVVISPEMTFEKKLDTPEIEREGEIQAFVDMVPFDHVSHKVITIGAETKVTAINRTLYDAVIDTFESRGFKISAVLPWSALIGLNPNLKWGDEAAKYLYHHLDRLKNASFLTPTVAPEGVALHRQYINRHPWVVAGVSIASLFVTFGTAYMTLKPAPRPKPTAAFVQVAATTTPVVTEISEITPTVRPITDVKVTIQISSPKSSITKDVEEKLASAGIVNLKIAKNPVNATRLLLQISAKIEPEYVEILRNSLKDVDSNVTVQVVDDLSVDAVITLPVDK